jgi:hypothetical protein
MTNKIIEAYTSESETLPELLNALISEADYITPCIYIEWLKNSGTDEPLDHKALLNCQFLYPLLNLLDKETSKKISELLKGYKEIDVNEKEISRKELFEMIETIQQAGYKLLSAICPNEWRNYLFVYKKPNDVLPYYLMHHFEVAKDLDKEFFDEFFQDFNKSLDKYLNDNYDHLDIKDREELKYNIVDDTYSGKICNDNVEILNLNEEFFEMAKKGLLAGKKYCS